METLIQMTDLYNISTQLIEMYPNASTKDIIKVACDVYEDQFEGDISESALQLLENNLKKVAK
jgi:hypothetical protein